MMLRRIWDARGSTLNTSGGSTGMSCDISASEPTCMAGEMKVTEESGRKREKVSFIDENKSESVLLLQDL